MRWAKLPPGWRLYGARAVPCAGPPRSVAQRKSSRPAAIPLMNSWELLYSRELDLRRAAGEVTWWSYEPVKLRLARRTFYTPDFLVRHKDGSLELVEVKGFWRDDARVKLKVAAEQYPMFRFRAVRMRGACAETVWESTHHGRRSG